MGFEDEDVGIEGLRFQGLVRTLGLKGVIELFGLRSETTHGAHVRLQLPLYMRASSIRRFVSCPNKPPNIFWTLGGLGGPRAPRSLGSRHWEALRGPGLGRSGSPET